MIASLNNFDKIINSLIFNRQKHLLFLTIIIGSFLRFYNLNWDGGYQGHPDESNLVKASVGLDIPNQLDPRFYSYGGFLMYSMRIVSETLHILTGNSEWITSAAAMTVSGRIVTALCSSISIYLIYVLLKYFFSKRFALVGAILMSFSVGFIQYSKYAISDAPLFMSLLIIAIFTARVIQNNTIKNWTSLGISCGLGLSIKSTSISFLILPIIAWLITFPDKSNLKYLIYKSIVLTSTTLITFFILSPYYFINYKAAIEALDIEQGIATGRYPRAFTVQFIGKIDYLYFLQNIPWHLGTIVTICGVIGLLLWLYLILKKKYSVEGLPIIVFGIIFFIYVGQWHAKFIRYMLPFQIILIISCVFLFNFLYQKNKLKRIAQTLILLTIVTSFIWSTAFISIFNREHSRITASKWIYTNIPKGSNLIIEAWDYALPISFKDGYQSSVYNQFVVDTFSNDNDLSKIKSLAVVTENADYFIISSRRVYATIINNPKLYPHSSRYYEKLLNGELGFYLIKEFIIQPSLGPITIDDSQAEETFRVYDHPYIFIYKNTQKIKSDVILEMIG